MSNNDSIKRRNKKCSQQSCKVNEVPTVLGLAQPFITISGTGHACCYN